MHAPMFFYALSPNRAMLNHLGAVALAGMLSVSTLLSGCGGGGGGTASTTATGANTIEHSELVNTNLAQTAPATPARFAVGMDDLEVIGPFPSWANAKRDYGAVGDGVTDDAPALQRALNELGQSGKPSVLYLPAGTYKIGTTLRLTGNSFGTGFLGIGIIGESPSTTKIAWAGTSGGTMLIQDGGYNVRYSRITWDGKGSAGIGIAHWWNSAAGTMYDASSEDVDEVFQDMDVGIMAGRTGTNYGQMNSEGQVRRVTFLRNRIAGVDTGSWNAVNWWVWDSHFVDCARGVSNTYGLGDSGVINGSGGFHVYRSLFERSTVADVDIINTGWFSMYHNVSVGSRRFFQGAQVGRNAAPTVIKGNRIVDTTDPAAIVSGNLGPLMLIDNQIRSNAGATTAAVVMNDIASGRDVVSVGNAYTVANPIRTVDGTDRLVSIDDSTVSRSSISATPLTLPSTPSWQSRRVFEVPVGANSAQIQSVINAAVASGATNAIVHLPPGTYRLTSTLVVPPRSRIQIAGDALTTVLNWQGTAGSTMIQLQSPSYATIRDLQMWGGTSTAISMPAANQSGGRILIMGSSTGPLQGSDLTLTQLQLQANPGVSSMQLSNVQSFVAMGTGGIGPVVSNRNTSALVADTWYEGTDTHLYRLASGTFTFVGGHLAPASHSGALLPNDPAILLDGFTGKSTFLATYFDLNGVPSGVGIQIGTETSSTNALFMGMASNKAGYFQRNSSGGNVGLNTSKTADGSGVAMSTPDQGTSGNAFVTSMLAQLRALQWDSAPATVTDGATDVRIYRVKANQSAGISVSAN
ncbi:MAG TPA: glycosyl hydrolase family 28-related protein [Aquabacterium sp.]|nr:glycosyl hydrolase family 28-related protein [Aquabacterium sp.]